MNLGMGCRDATECGMDSDLVEDFVINALVPTDFGISLDDCDVTRLWLDVFE